jgi:palmitoyltransferase
MKKKSSKSIKSKSKDKKDKSVDKKSKSSKSKSKKSSRSNSKEKSEKNLEESINPEISGINKEPGQNNNLDFTYTQYFTNKNQPNTNPNLHNNPNNKPPPGTPVPKCDGCFENDSVCFCKECKKYLCNICDNQIHIIPANSNHLRVNLNDINKTKKLCYHHQLNLEFFCESCDETICKQCQIIGPHNTNYHRIIDIKEAFNKKYYQLAKTKPILMNKLSELNYYNNRVTELNKKVNLAKKDLVRDIRAQYTAMSEKIKDIEGKRNAVLSYETSQLNIDNNNIQDINNYISDVQAQKNISMINFLLQFPHLKKRMERILEKPLKENIDLSNIEDFPNELEERHKILDDYNNVIKLSESKDEIIYRVISEKKNKEKIILENARKRSMEQIEEKAKMSDKFDKYLKKFMVVCSFCGKYIDIKSVNSECQANEQFYLNFYFTKEAPPNEYINTKRHFFGEPVNNKLDELLKIAETMWEKQRNEINNKLKDEENNKQELMQSQNNVNNNSNYMNIQDNANLVSKNRDNLMTSNENLFNNNPNLNSRNQMNTLENNINNILQSQSMTKQSNPIIRQENSGGGPHEFINSSINMENNPKLISQNLLRIIEQKNIDLYTLLCGYDLNEDGVLEKNELKFALDKISQLNNNQFEALINLFNLGDKINIKDFISLFNMEFVNKLSF